MGTSRRTKASSGSKTSTPDAMIKMFNRVERALRKRWEAKTKRKDSEDIRREIKDFWTQVICLRHELRAALDGRLVSAAAWEGPDEEGALANFGPRLGASEQQSKISKVMAKSEELLARYERWRKYSGTSVLSASGESGQETSSLKDAQNKASRNSNSTSSKHLDRAVIHGPDPMLLSQQLGWMIEELSQKQKLATERYERELKNAPGVAIRSVARRPPYIISFFDIVRGLPPKATKSAVYRLSREDYLNEISWTIEELKRWRASPSPWFPIDLLVWAGECLGAFHQHTRSGRTPNSDVIRYNRRVIALIYQADDENAQAKLNNKKKAPWFFHTVCRAVFRLTKRYPTEFPGKDKLKNGARSDSIVKPVRLALEDAGIELPKEERHRGRSSKKQ